MIKAGAVILSALAVFASAGHALSPEQAHAQFKAGWAKTECALQHPTYQPAYAKCHAAPAGILALMDRAYLMRSSCQHPIFFTELTQIAYDCSDAHKSIEGATGFDVSACFEEAFMRDYNPAKVHYCAGLEAVKQ